MERKILPIIFFLSVFFWPQPVGAIRAANVNIGKGEASISYLAGAAQVMSRGTDVSHTLKINDKLAAGAEVSTGSKTKIELIMPDKSRLRFADNSRFKLVQIEAGEAEPRAIKVHLALGKAWANVSKAVGAGSSFALTCENAIAGVRGTIYRLDVNEDKSALVKVYDGAVAVTGGGKALEPPQLIGAPQKIAGPRPVAGPKPVSMEEWTFVVEAMQQIAIGGDGKPQKPRPFTELEDQDSWVEWNKAQDSRHDQ